MKVDADRSNEDFKTAISDLSYEEKLMLLDFVLAIKAERKAAS